MSSRRAPERDPDHAILPDAWQFEIVGFNLVKEPVGGTEPFLDLTLRRGQERRVLRFWSPVDIEIERGGPDMTHGLVIIDVRARGLERLGVEVDDFENSGRKVHFLARTVEDITATR